MSLMALTLLVPNLACLPGCPEARPVRTTAEILLTKTPQQIIMDVGTSWRIDPDVLMAMNLALSGLKIDHASTRFFLTFKI